jgi:hypothetical protein
MTHSGLRSSGLYYLSAAMKRCQPILVDTHTV